MNKENKKKAQMKRAEERQKAQKKATVINVLKIWVPIIAVIIVAVVLVWAVATSGGSQSDSNTQTTEKTSQSETDTATEKSLDKTEGVEAKDGDTVNIDYTGYLDGVEFQGGSTKGNGADLELGSNTYIDGFEDGIVGHTVGETFDLNLKFPEQYPNSPELAGKDVVFTVTLNGIYK